MLFDSLWPKEYNFLKLPKTENRTLPSCSHLKETQSPQDSEKTETEHTNLEIDSKLKRQPVKTYK